MTTKKYGIIEKCGNEKCTKYNQEVNWYYNSNRILVCSWCGEPQIKEE